MRFRSVAFVFASSSLALTCWFGVTGCASGGQSPSGVIGAYARAIEEGRSDDAYALLSEEARRSITRANFRALVEHSAVEAKELATALRRTPTQTEMTAVVRSADGDEVHFVFENGRWKLELDGVDLYAQATPRLATLSFLRAVEHGRYDILLGLVPEAHRAGLTAEKLKAAWEGPDRNRLREIATSVRGALASRAFEESGSRAQLAHAEGILLLVREQGVWKIEDFD